MLGAGAAIVSVSMLGLILVASTEAPSLVGIVLLVALFVSVTGLMGANSVAILLKLFPGNAGAAAGLAVSSQFALGAAFSAWWGVWLMARPAQCAG